MKKSQKMNANNIESKIDKIAEKKVITKGDVLKKTQKIQEVTRVEGLNHMIYWGG